MSKNLKYALFAVAVLVAVLGGAWGLGIALEDAEWQERMERDRQHNARLATEAKAASPQPAE